MSKNESPTTTDISEKQRDKLRTSLAIARGMKLLDDLDKEAHSTVEQDGSKRAAYFESLFLRIHREIFQDWQQQPSSHRPGYIPEARKRADMREAIHSILCKDGNGNGTLFDSNGFVVSHSKDDLADLLAAFYKKMRAIEPFEYGNNMTLDLFVTALGRLPAYKAVYPEGIDLRRLDEGDRKVLRNPDSTIKELRASFRHASQMGPTPRLTNPPNGYGQWPSSSVEVLGIPFLSYKSKDDTLCLVTMNGGLVPFKAVRKKLEADIVSGKMIAEYPPIERDSIVGYLPGTEHLREAGRTQVDGFPVSDNASPLFCLDVNVLTGLRKQDNDPLELLIERQTGVKGATLLLAGNTSLKERLLNAAVDDRQRRSIAIAYSHVSFIKHKLDVLQNGIFAGKTAVEKPLLMMSQGGAGSGKSAVEEIVRAGCGDNFVITSLDEFRKSSELYTVLTKAMHHGDDYRVIDPFALTMRQSVADKAKRDNINILYDGTGITYKDRYDKIAKDFKSAGFICQVCAVDAPVTTAIPRVIGRYKSEDRALPWPVVVGKHMRAAASFMQAAEDKSLDKISLFSNDGEKGQHYLVAESFMLNDADMKALQSHKLAGTLASHLKSIISHHQSSTLRYLADHENIQDLVDRIPNFKEKNVAYITVPSLGQNHVLAVYDVEQFRKFMNKGIMNPHASCLEGLTSGPSELPVELWQKKLKKEITPPPVQR